MIIYVIIYRMVDQRNSLENYFKERVEFINSWKLKYLLQTSDQQKYFWAYILAIVTKMKLIDIQFKSQLIARNLSESNDDTKDDTKSDDQLKQDKRYMDLYPGSLIPPNDVWNIHAIKTDKYKKLSSEWTKTI